LLLLLLLLLASRPEGAVFLVSLSLNQAPRKAPLGFFRACAASFTTHQPRSAVSSDCFVFFFFLWGCIQNWGFIIAFIRGISLQCF
jgi:hypothetical protein